MIKPLKYVFVFCLLGLVLFNSCVAPKEGYSSKENLYKKNTSEIAAKFLAYHITDSLTQIYFTLSNENFLYKRPDTSGYFYSATKVKCFLYANAKTKQLLDSGSVTIFDRQTENVNTKDLKGSLFSKCKTGQSYVCDIWVYDLNKKTRVPFVIEIDKTSAATRQNFLLQKTNGNVIYDYNLVKGDTIIIKSFMNTANDYIVDYFKNEFPLPPPPFSNFERPPFNYKPDSSFAINRTFGVLKLVAPAKGFYHLLTDNISKNGITLFSVDPSFPGIKNETEMIRSTRYVTDIKEYTALLEAENKKLAIDKFWLEKGGSNERAKELIRKYYGHVQQANKLFTSYQPGWQTDRGMIYVVFGPPTTMFKYAKNEVWVYGNELQPGAIRFTFVKVINPFTDNDFSLERNEIYKYSWYQAVTGWKEGHLFFDN